MGWTAAKSLNELISHRRHYNIIGIQRSGIRRSGIWQSGIRRSGIRRSGNRRSGIRRSGNWQSGIRRSGNRRSGIRRSGRTPFLIGARFASHLYVGWPILMKRLHQLRRLNLPVGREASLLQAVQQYWYDQSQRETIPWSVDHLFIFSRAESETGMKDNLCIWSSGATSVPVAYLGDGHWAMAPFGHENQFWPYKKHKKTRFSPFFVEALVVRENPPLKSVTVRPTWSYKQNKKDVLGLHRSQHEIYDNKLNNKFISFKSTAS